MAKSNRAVQLCAGICASLGFLFTGAGMSWSSPALPKFKNGEAPIHFTDAQTSWVVSMMTIGSLPGCYIGQVLCEKIGRKRTILTSVVPALIGSAVILFTRVPGLLYFARLCQGVTTGIVAVVTMIYITEIADKEIRGALGMLVQVMNNLGSLLVYGIGPFVSYAALNSMVLSIPIIYALCCLWIPESPYYYIKDEKIYEAKKTYMKIKSCKDEKMADEQLGLIRAHVRESMENKTTMKELVTKQQYRSAIYIIMGLKILQYMTGSVAIQSYLEMIFRQGGSVSGPKASILYGFVQLGAGIIATFLPIYFGKRILMLVSSLGSGIMMSLVGAYFFMQDYLQVSEATLDSIALLPIICILGFNILYTIGLGNLPYVMQAEVFPMNVKATASSAATMAACIFSFTVAKSYQTVKDTFGHYTVFWIFAFVSYVGVFFIYFFVPETSGKTLEQVQDDMKRVDERVALSNDDQVKGDDEDFVTKI